MKAKIWHNPNCGSSRAALERLTSRGVEPDIYLYLKECPSKDDLRDVLKKLGLKPSELLRRKEPLADELGLNDARVLETKILAALAAHPRLIQRPIVITRKGAVVARPPLRVDEVL